jgi:hypothetical protein
MKKAEEKKFFSNFGAGVKESQIQNLINNHKKSKKKYKLNRHRMNKKRGIKST